ncbi:hypothetical protein, partial [uncultured Sphingomonas sp.]|uniref:hypothetical protein n=1 Tax=uncultured Sphingomonas sp. TaxID=158754 RepID=UPI0025D0B648
MTRAAHERYGDLMFRIRQRFELARTVQVDGKGSFTRSEVIAFQLRKIIEGTAFGCLIAIDHGLKHVPRDAVGQWAADQIFRSLAKKNMKTVPSPSIIRKATEEEQAAHQATIVVQGTPSVRLTAEELIDIYQRTHIWLHELNPFVRTPEDLLNVQENVLWDDLDRVWRFLERHFISIRGEGFFCTLKDKVDEQVKVLPLTKV